MAEDVIQTVLQRVKDGDLSPEDAVPEMRRRLASETAMFARIDHDRERRCGFPEVVLAEGKTPEQVHLIARQIVAMSGRCLITRVSNEQAVHLSLHLPGGEHDPVGRTVWYGGQSTSDVGHVIIVTAGTADLPVAREAEKTASVMGARTDFIADVGVAGLHRLLAVRPQLEKADVVIVAAGMEGALPSVVGGLVAVPVIAVPTSVGYGASFHGVAALLGMLSSCAANVVVVNIDAGFCAGYVAALIARTGNRQRRPSDGLGS